VTVPETTCPQAGFVVADAVEAGEAVEDGDEAVEDGDEAVEDGDEAVEAVVLTLLEGVFVNCVCVSAIASVGCIVNAPNAAKETIVATMYDIVVRFIYRTLGDKLFM
jgi:hypothetical protein